jgi:PPOX class probable F420-dependent enzyme
MSPMTERSDHRDDRRSDPGAGRDARRDALLALLAERHFGVLVTHKRDGRAQLSNVAYHYDGDDRTIRISVTDDRAKTANLRRDPRASFHVASDDFWAYTVVEGMAGLSPVAAAPGDATVDELVALFREVQGEHPDWDEFRASMVAERRLVVRVPVQHVYGQAR